MSENISLKRNIDDVVEVSEDKELSPPKSKQVKVNEESSELNLKNEDFKNNDTSDYESLKNTQNSEKLDEIDSVNVSETCVVEETQTTIEISTESSFVDETTNKAELTPEESPVCSSICITFQNDEIAELYKSKFINFINSLSEFRISDEDLTLKLYREISEIKTDEISPKKRKKRSKIKKELFVVDATPSPTTLQKRLRYTTKFTINTEKVEEKNVQIAKSNCFNCSGDHSLKDCTQPKDFGRINEAKKKFKSQQNKSSRYHLESDQKFSHLQPGNISPELRKALGLHRNEAPHFIYLMRQLGYPPGWLEEAKIVHSNLDMYDIDGNVKINPTVRKSGLDESKIIEYPGFNVPFQKDVKDDYRSYRVPPYSENFSKQAMISFFEKSFAQEQDNLETCDMDIDHDPDCLEKNLENKRESPTLIDLEQQKLQLLEELNEDPKKDSSESDTEKDKNLLTVKTSCFGTPILKSSSPYSKLPDPDNFSKDVSPVINFENLPNATGKYEQLTNVLQKVRTTMKKMNTSCST